MRRFLIILFLSIPILLFSQPQKLTKIRVSPQWTAQSQFAGIYMAYKNGYYKEKGLDVEIIHPSVSNSSINKLMKGETDIITSQLIEAMLYKDSGIPLVNFLQVSSHNSLLIFTRDPMKNISDLNNKKVGRWKIGFYELAMIFVLNNGVQVEWVPFLNNVSLFVSGAIDATLCMTYNEMIQLEAAGFDMEADHTFMFKDLGYDVPEDGFYVTDQFFNKNKETLKLFAEATKQGWNWVRMEENREATIDYVMQMVKANNIPTNRVIQTKMLDRILELQEDDGKAPYKLTKNAFEFAERLLEINNFLTKPIKYEEFVKNF